jgi:phosphoglycerate dehydrogenase-like enzyme
LIKESDFISINTPLTPSTKGLINKEKIALMKKNAIVINTARGPVVDNDALAEALKSGRIGGACIDVFDKEPPLEKDYSLLSAPNTVLIPHIGFATEEAMVRRAHIVFDDNIAGYIRGEHVNKVI